MYTETDSTKLRYAMLMFMDSDKQQSTPQRASEADDNLDIS